jgi:hypothetical protein
MKLKNSPTDAEIDVKIAQLTNKVFADGVLH